ncbi:hypothetical protein M3Y98_00409200 [Aphelenchoides besseyi]|nr:hypothetical protein M3Y98_00409200 [Aphelenchoides besseyi]KAI6202020.1 hypothetical protein M3Y96_00904000 [Aphelenchoides besseyi]
MAINLTDVLLIQDVFLFICVLISFLSQLTLLFKHKCLRQRYSPILLLNVGLWCITTFCGILYSGYLTIISTANRNGILIFIFGTCWVSFSISVSTSVTFLLLDRIYILSTPTDYQFKRNRLLFLSFFCCTFVVLFVVLSLALTELPVDEATLCNSFGCVLKHHHGLYFTITKIVTGFVNIVTALVFERILFKYTNGRAIRKQFKKANFLTLIAAISEFFCNFLPNMIFLLLSQLEMPGNEKLGPYAGLMIGIDALMNAFIYRFIITSQRRNSKSSLFTVTPSNTAITSNLRHLSASKFFHNNHPHVTTRVSPF